MSINVFVMLASKAAFVCLLLYHPSYHTYIIICILIYVIILSIFVLAFVIIIY